MLSKIKNYTKFIFGIVALLHLLFISTLTHKQPIKPADNSTNKRDDNSTPQIQQDNNSNDFLFVDCTGFFE